MRRRLLPAARSFEVYVDAPAYLHAQPEPEQDLRSPVLVEALARLEAATRLRDGDAVARILGNLADTDDGQWLLRQCVAAGLREVAAAIADDSGSAAKGDRHIGPAA